MTTTSTTPRVYIACLAAYNSGILHGAWCDAIDADEVREAIEEVLTTSPVEGAEEYAIHDYEGFGSHFIGEHPDIDDLCELGAWLDEADEPKAVLTFLTNEPNSFSSIDDAKEAFEESFVGETTLVEYAEEFMHEVYDIPDFLVNYIDYEAFARDLRIDGYYEENGYVFRPY